MMNRPASCQPASAPLTIASEGLLWQIQQIRPRKLASGEARFLRSGALLALERQRLGEFGGSAMLGLCLLSVR